MLFLLQLFFYAAALPLPGLAVNHKWHLRETTTPPASPAGFHATYANDEYEVVLQGTALPNAELAAQKAQVSLANIRNLYKPHSNPYEGQVSDLIQCTAGLLPKVSDISLKNFARGKASLLVGGVTGRKMFGACSKDQVEFWGGYFQFYFEPQGMAVEVRMFMKNRLPLDQARAKLKALGEQLFVKSGNPL